MWLSGLEKKKVLLFTFQHMCLLAAVRREIVFKKESEVSKKTAQCSKVVHDWSAVWCCNIQYRGKLVYFCHHYVSSKYDSVVKMTLQHDQLWFASPGITSAHMELG